LNCYYFSPTSFSRVPVDPRGLAGEEDVGEWSLAAWVPLPWTRASIAVYHHHSAKIDRATPIVLVHIEAALNVDTVTAGWKNKSCGFQLIKMYIAKVNFDKEVLGDSEHVAESSDAESLWCSWQNLTENKRSKRSARAAIKGVSACSKLPTVLLYELYII
jgi:hypothetical protein